MPSQKNRSWPLALLFFALAGGGVIFKRLQVSERKLLKNPDGGRKCLRIKSVTFTEMEVVDLKVKFIRFFEKRVALNFNIL